MSSNWVPTTEIPVKAIVFDANVFGAKVEPNIDSISTWASSCVDHGAELWIPELVALELAQRCVKSSQEFANTVGAHNTRRRVWGLNQIEEPQVVTIDEILQAIEYAGATIVETDGASAAEGLRDQVTTTGMGTVSSGVKTGASDGAWIRSVIAANGGTADGIIWVTNDTKARNFLVDRLQVDESVIAPHLGAIRRMLPTEPEPADDDQEVKFLSALPWLDDRPKEISQLAIIYDEHWQSPLLHAQSHEWEMQDRTFAIAELPTIVEDLTYDPWTGALLAEVELILTVREQYVDYGSTYSFIEDEYEIEVTGEAVVTKDATGNWTWTEFNDATINVAE